jgi:hypothetical protein
LVTTEEQGTPGSILEVTIMIRKAANFEVKHANASAITRTRINAIINAFMRAMAMNQSLECDIPEVWSIQANCRFASEEFSILVRMCKV